MLTISVGDVFGRLTVTSTPCFRRKGKRRCLYVDTRCECGNEVSALVRDLETRSVLSCGCGREKVRRLSVFKHKRRHYLMETQEDGVHLFLDGPTDHVVFDLGPEVEERIGGFLEQYEASRKRSKVKPNATNT